MRKLLIILSILLITSSSYAAINRSTQSFQQLFDQWTQGFNQKNLETSCRLFAISVTANYQGVPSKNYADICDGFKKIFQETHREYRYRFHIHDVYQSGQLAAVRITWYLEVYENKKLIQSIQDEGLDILEQDMNGAWRIVNYIAYPVQQTT